MKTRAVSLTLAVLLTPSADTWAQSVDDLTLTETVSRSVQTYPRFTIFDDVNVLAEAGTVTLSGRVTIELQRDEIGRRVERIRGVRAVRNEIAALPVSIYDDELRRKLARAIYGNPTFWRYAAMASPPIHIIVENGIVTLTGVVPSDVDRALARSLATGQGELGVVNLLRTDSEARSERAAMVERATGRIKPGRE